MKLSNVVISLYGGEKAAIKEENGIYTFLVNPLASKLDIKDFLEAAYSTKVKKINTVTTKKKVRVRKVGKFVSPTKVEKKAIVSFGGKRIDVFASSNV